MPGKRVQFDDETWRARFAGARPWALNIHHGAPLPVSLLVALIRAPGGKSQSTQRTRRSKVEQTPPPCVSPQFA
jgi:hypothetical protein